MAEFKKIMLQDNKLTETVDKTEDTAVEKQVGKFSTDYSADKLNELYNEFDSITLDNSSIDSLTKKDAVAVEKLSARTKLYLTAGVVITALLLFLMIYNFFVISKVQNSINILQDDLVYQEQMVTNKGSQLDNLTDESVLKDQLTEMGYGAVDADQIVKINSGNYGYSALEGESNWFDKFCDFVSSIFGG